jgi:hypothetical protein
MTQAAAEHNRNIELIDDIIGCGHCVVERKDLCAASRRCLEAAREPRTAAAKIALATQT